MNIQAIGLVTLLSLTSPIALAQGPIKIGQQQKSQVSKPKHGQSMEQVESVFGTPVQKHNAVGEPPITRWQYAGFTVYFEHDKVIHSVTHKS